MKSLSVCAPSLSDELAPIDVPALRRPVHIIRSASSDGRRCRYSSMSRQAKPNVRSLILGRGDMLLTGASAMPGSHQGVGAGFGNLSFRSTQLLRSLAPKCDQFLRTP